MGWKSTIDLTRQEAIQAILECLTKKSFDKMTTSELDDLMCSLGIGDDFDKPYFGYNFNIID